MQTGHQAKQLIRNKVGLPRYYVRLPGSRGTCDGRTDRQSLTQEEGDLMVLENREEMEGTAAAITALDESSEDEIQDVTPGASRQARGPRVEETRRNINSGVSTGNELAREDSVPESTTPQVFTGLEHPRTFVRLYCEENQPGTVINAISCGYEVKKTFSTRENANKWTSANVMERTTPAVVHHRNFDCALTRDISNRSTPAVSNLRSTSEFGTDASQAPQQRVQSDRRVVEIITPSRENELSTQRSDYNDNEALQNRTYTTSHNNDYSRSSTVGNYVPAEASLYTQGKGTTTRGNGNNSDDDSSIELVMSQRTPQPKPKAKKTWFGAERASTQERAITSHIEVLKQLQDNQYEVKETFQTRNAAEKWLNEEFQRNSEPDAHEPKAMKSWFGVEHASTRERAITSRMEVLN